MVEQNQNNEDEKGQEETKTVQIGSRTYNRLKNYSNDSEKSVTSILNDAVNNEITRCEVKEILTEKCESGKLPKNSRVCKAILDDEHY